MTQKKRKNRSQRTIQRAIDDHNTWWLETDYRSQLRETAFLSCGWKSAWGFSVGECAAFAGRWAQEAGLFFPQIQYLEKWSAYEVVDAEERTCTVKDFRVAGEKWGLWTPLLNEAKPGDIFVTEGESHCGIVQAITGPLTFDAIEANYSKNIEQRGRSLQGIAGFIAI